MGWRANSPSLLSLLSPPSLLSLLHSVNEITGPLICLFYHVIISALSRILAVISIFFGSFWPPFGSRLATIPLFVVTRLSHGSSKTLEMHHEGM